ncbi:MAG: hypothetical protein NTY47_01785, partial [Candidatus Omnitrophica bacterium]|nr:hypothetical protein [Candidatus Omnitrophota bacterium]
MATFKTQFDETVFDRSNGFAIVHYGEIEAKMAPAVGGGRASGSSDLGITHYPYKGEFRTDACMYNGKPLWRLVGDIMTFFDPSESGYEKPVLSINVKTGEDVYRYEVEVKQDVNFGIKVVETTTIDAKTNGAIKVEGYLYGKDIRAYYQLGNLKVVYEYPAMLEIDLSQRLGGIQVKAYGKVVSNVTSVSKMGRDIVKSTYSTTGLDHSVVHEYAALFSKENLVNIDRYSAGRKCPYNRDYLLAKERLHIDNNESKYEKAMYMTDLTGKRGYSVYVNDKIGWQDHVIEISKTAEVGTKLIETKIDLRTSLNPHKVTETTYINGVAVEVKDGGLEISLNAKYYREELLGLLKNAAFTHVEYIKYDSGRLVEGVDSEGNKIIVFDQGMQFADSKGVLVNQGSKKEVETRREVYVRHSPLTLERIVEGYSWDKYGNVKQIVKDEKGNIVGFNICDRFGRLVKDDLRKVSNDNAFFDSSATLSSSKIKYRFDGHVKDVADVVCGQPVTLRQAFISEKDSYFSEYDNLPGEIKAKLLKHGLSAETLLTPAETRSASGPYWVDYRLPEDPNARVIVSCGIKGEKIIGVAWQEKGQIECYRTTPLGLIYHRKTILEGTSAGDILPQRELINAAKISIYPDTRLPTYIETPGLFVNGKISWADNASKTYYLLPDDRLGRSLVVQDSTGQKGIEKWWDLEFMSPFDASPGYRVYRGEKIIRETAFNNKPNGDQAQSNNGANTVWYYNGGLETIEFSKLLSRSYNWENGISMEAHSYVQGPDINIYFYDDIPLYSAEVIDGKEIPYSEFDTWIYIKDNDLYMVTADRISDACLAQKGILGRLSKGSKDLVDGKERVTLYKNGNRLLEQASRWNIARTKEKTTWSLKDQLGNSSFGDASKFVEAKVRQARKLIEESKKQGKKIDNKYGPAKEDSMLLENTSKELRKFGLNNIVYPIAILVGLLALFGLVWQVIKRCFWAKMKFGLNNFTEKDLFDCGFTKAEATTIIEKRKEKIGFINISDFRDSLAEDLARTIALMNNNWVFGKNANVKRQKIALDRFEAVTSRYVPEVKVNIDASYQAETTIEGVLAKAGFLSERETGAQDTLTVVAGIMEKGSLTLEQVKGILAMLQQFSGSMTRDEFQSRFLAQLANAAYFDADTRMNIEKRAAIEKRLRGLFSNLGLGIDPSEDSFCGENAFLFETIINSIYYAANFEELDLPREFSPSGFYVVANDDLEKEAVRLVQKVKKAKEEGTEVGDVTIESFSSRWRLVSLEHYVLMQVISAQVITMNGNGRFEEWLYQKIVTDTRISRWFENIEHGKLIIKSMQNIYLPLLDLFWEQQGGARPVDAGKQEKVKDRFGVERFHKWSLLWEEWNDAFRFLLGQSELNLDGKLYVQGEELKAKINALRAELDAEVTKLFNGGELNPDFLMNLEKALIFSVERATKLPRIKHRLKHYQLFWMPVWKAILDSNLRKQIFNKKNIYGEHLADISKKLYVAIVFVVNLALFVPLSMIAVSKWYFLSIPKAISFNPYVLGAIALIYILIHLGSLYFRNKAIKQKDAAKTARLHKLQLFIQFTVLIGGTIFILFIGEPLEFVVPGFVQIGLKVLAYALLFETFRLSFYAIHYALKGILSYWHYRVQNIYSVNSKGELVDGLVRIFTNKTSGWYGASKTLGQERMKEFAASVLRDLSDPKDYQLLISNEDRKAWENLLAEISKDQDMDKDQIEKRIIALLKNDSPATQKERIHRLIRWANDQIRTDKPRPPRTFRDFLPYCVSMQGFGEDQYFSFSQLNGHNEVEGCIEKNTRFGLIAQSKPGYWRALVDRLEEGIEVDGQLVRVDTTEKEQLLHLLTDPHSILEVASPGLKNYLERWANSYLADLWNNAFSALKIKRRYAFTLGMLMPRSSEEELRIMVEAKTSRIMVKHAMSFAETFEMGFFNSSSAERTIQSALNKIRVEELTADKKQALEEIFPVNCRNQVMRTLREYMYYFVPRLRLAYNLGILNERHLKDELERIIALIVSGGKNADSLSPLMEAVVIYGLSATWNRTNKKIDNWIEQVHSFKWNSLTASLPYTFGLTLDLIDADHHARTEDIWSAPEAMLEYLYNPRLGSSIGIIEHYLAEDFGVLGKIVPPGENAFTFHAQMGKILMGGLTAYGKFLVRTRAMRWSEGLSGDDYVAEDSETVVRFRAFGYECGRAGYYRRGKSWMYLIIAHITSNFKWSNDSGESVMGRIPVKMVLSGKVEWSYLIDNFWWDGFGFYLKKPHVVRYLKWLAAFYLIFNWNLFIGLPLVLWLGSLALSQAISYGTLFNYRFEKHQT